MTNEQPDIYNAYDAELKRLDADGLLRELAPCTAREGCFVQRGGRRLLNLSANDYLGLATDAELHREFYASMTSTNLLTAYGLGSSASRLMTGSSALYAELESFLAEAYGREALVFNSGYHANTGILPALCGPGDLIVSDKLNHASIIDGMRLSGARFVRYRHGDMAHCADQLARAGSDHRRILLVTESIFSMDGDRADLAALVRLKNEVGAVLYVDEAHAVGVRGSAGLGLSEELGILDDVDILVGTFGKAMASVGAYAIVHPVLRRFLVNRMRPFIYTTALPPISVHWNLFVLRKLESLHAERSALDHLAARFRQALEEAGLQTGGDSQIVPVQLGGSRAAVQAAAHLQEHGYLVLPVRPPTVPAGTSRLRLSLSAGMRWDDLADIPRLLHATGGDAECR